MRASCLASVLLLSVAALGCSSKGGGPVTVPPTAVPPVPFAATANPTQAVADECELDTKLPAYLQAYAEGATPAAAAPASGRVLEMQYTQVQGTAGGVYSGAKGISVEGTLRDGDQVLGTFKARRSTGGGPMGGYKGTCSLLHRTAKVTARDISEWLVAPTMDAKLGEQR